MKEIQDQTKQFLYQRDFLHLVPFRYAEIEGAQEPISIRKC